MIERLPPPQLPGGQLLGQLLRLVLLAGLGFALFWLALFARGRLQQHLWQLPDAEVGRATFSRLYATGLTGRLKAEDPFYTISRTFDRAGPAGVNQLLAERTREQVSPPYLAQWLGQFAALGLALLYLRHTGYAHQHGRRLAWLLVAAGASGLFVAGLLGRPPDWSAILTGACLAVPFAFNWGGVKAGGLVLLRVALERPLLASHEGFELWGLGRLGSLGLAFWQGVAVCLPVLVFFGLLSVFARGLPGYPEPNTYRLTGR